jgi:hypothetical protein
VGWRVHDLKGKYHFSRDVIFNESVSGHLSPHRGNQVDFDQLPAASVIPEDHLQSNIAPLSTPKPHTTSIPFPTPSLADTIRNRDIAIAEHSQRATRSSTNSLPPMRRHYNDIETINMFVYLNELDAFLVTSPLSKIIHNSSNDLSLLCDQSFLTVPPSFLQTRPPDLSRPPNSYHEAIS